MTLTALVLAALTSLVRPSVSWAPVPQERIELIADDIALAASLHDGAPFTGPHRRELAGLALAVIAIHESNLAEKVVSCRYDGDPMQGWKPGRGRSITHFQIMSPRTWSGHTKAEICSSGPLSAYLAATILARHARAPMILSVFRGYASGDASRRSAASERQCAMFERVAKRAGLAASCWARP